MFHAHGLSKSCSLLAVFCGEFVDRNEADVTGHASYPFQDLVSSGRLEVQTLVNPPVEKFREVQHLTNPNILYFQGERLVSGEEIGSLVWAGVDVSDPEKLSSLIGPSLPTAVYLEVQNSEKVAEALHSKGIPYVIYWKNGFSSYSASHFRDAFFSIVQSSCSHTWDAFQLAHASFRLYCVRNSNDSPINNRKVSGKLVPCLLGEAPKFSISPKEKDLNDEESSSDILPAISIYDVDVDIAFLVCGVPCTLDARLGSLEDGLNTLLKIEVRGSKLHNRVSATPPPLQAGGISPGVVTMRCDITTCSSAHISLLVSGSPQILFDDQLLETHIKNELIEKSQLVHALPSSGGNKICSVEPRRSSSIACGASVFEVCMKVPIWATQVLKQLAPDVSYRSLVTLGIASIQGSSVSSFEKEDAKRLLFFCTEQENLDTQDCTSLSPDWFRFPAPSRNGPVADQVMKLWSPGMTDEKVQNGIKGRNFPLVPVRQRLKVDAMRPIPHKRHNKMLPFSGTPEIDMNYNSYMKPTLPALPSTKHMLPNPVSRRKSLSNSRAQQRISLTPLPLKKHGCDRSPIRACSEEEFLSDVMQFLILRGHSRLIPQGGVSEFPDVILNAKRLDLYNLYREVVSRGGFHVGNGINWKGQVFSKMRNHTLTNRMTGVGNSLKRHYETYLLEYELAHDDVDGECCLLCHSSAPGDWVNCGLCGEWAHFGCDRRQGLGAFKDYAKTDGLEYICPQCSVSNARRKCLKMGNGI